LHVSGRRFQRLLDLGDLEHRLHLGTCTRATAGARQAERKRHAHEAVGLVRPDAQGRLVAKAAKRVGTLRAASVRDTPRR